MYQCHYFFLLIIKSRYSNNTHARLPEGRSVSSGHKTVPGASKKLYLPFIFDTSLSSLMVWNLQSYPTTVLNEWTFWGIKRYSDPSYIFHVIRTPTQPGSTSCHVSEVPPAKRTLRILKCATATVAWHHDFAGVNLEMRKRKYNLHDVLTANKLTYPPPKFWETLERIEIVFFWSFLFNTFIIILSIHVVWCK